MNIHPLGRIRSLAGVLLKDWPRYERALRAPDKSYLALCNRNEQLESASSGEGYECKWQWSSELHAPKYLPGLGRRLMLRSLSHHPIELKSAPGITERSPEITFIIGHRGVERIPHLLATLRSIAGQTDVAVECVVVEQDVESRLAGRLPSWVRHVLSPPPVAGMAYCRSWAFNLGAREARSPLLVLHDNDMLVPVDYSTALLNLVREGKEVINLKRFTFYLDKEHTDAVFAGRAGLSDRAPAAIAQNLEGGGSVAATRRAYEEIGGHDESFIGWGGEDNEFWERAQTRNVWPFASLPIVHLWHAAQPGKEEAGNQTRSLYSRLTKIPPEVRIARLRALDQGSLSGPAGYRTPEA